MQCVTCHVSDVRFHASPVTCYQRQQSQPQPQTLPRLTAPLCTMNYALQLTVKREIAHFLKSEEEKEDSISSGSLILAVIGMYRMYTAHNTPP